MGVATGMAFDEEDNLYVGDRSGTIFKIAPNRQIFVFATLEPSIAAYHLAFGPGGYLYVSGPTTSSFDSIYRISHTGRSRGVLSRPGPAAGHGLRRRGSPVRGRVAGRAQGRRAHHAGPRSRNYLFPVRALWGWHSRRRDPWSSPRRMRCIAWTWASRAGCSLRSDERRNHCGWLGASDRAAARHQFALSHRSTE